MADQIPKGYKPNVPSKAQQRSSKAQTPTLYWDKLGQNYSDLGLDENYIYNKILKLANSLPVRRQIEQMTGIKQFNKFERGKDLFYNKNKRGYEEREVFNRMDNASFMADMTEDMRHILIEEMIEARRLSAKRSRSHWANRQQMSDASKTPIKLYNDGRSIVEEQYVDTTTPDPLYGTEKDANSGETRKGLLGYYSYVTFDRQGLTRKSLRPDIWRDGVNNIVLLYQNGYKCRNYVYGWWEHAGFERKGGNVWSRKELKPYDFVTEAVNKFNKYNLEKYGVGARAVGPYAGASTIPWEMIFSADDALSTPGTNYAHSWRDKLH